MMIGLHRDVERMFRALSAPTFYKSPNRHVLGAIIARGFSIFRLAPSKPPAVPYALPPAVRRFTRCGACSSRREIRPGCRYPVNCRSCSRGTR